MEERENIKVALLREVKEETGLEIEITAFCGISQEISKSIINTWWMGRVVGGTITSSEESIEVCFFDQEAAISRIDKIDFRVEVEHILRVEQHPFVLIFDHP